VKNILILFVFIIFLSNAFGQIENNLQLPTSINTTGAAPNASAILDIDANDKGVLIPRMTMTERDLISSPASGLLIYQTDNTSGFYYYDGTSWTALTGGSGSADNDWTDTGSGIYTLNKVAINKALINPLHNFEVFRSINDTAVGKSNIYAYRAGANDATTGSTAWTLNQVETAIKGYSDFGNPYSAAVYGGGFLDFPNSAAVIGANNNASIYGALGYREDASNVWAGYFNGNIKATGDVTANKFIGDGSMLTNLPGGGGGCTDYGDGTAGALVISSNTDWTTSPPASGNYMFSSLTINAGATLTVASGTRIQVSGMFQNDGIIDVKFGSEGSRPSANPLGSYPAVKGTSLTQQFAFPEEQLRFLSTTSLLLGGSNGIHGNGTDAAEQGGGGGGLLTIKAADIINSGTIKANGGDGAVMPGTSTAAGASGGGGGFIFLQTNSITNLGTIEANGGDGGPPGGGDTDFAGGGGGGGLVRVVAPNALAIGGTINVNEGTGGVTPAGNMGSGGATGGAGVGGNGGLGGGMENGSPVPAEPGLIGVVIKISVTDPCSVDN